MIYRRLGKTDLSVSIIGFGCWQLGGPLMIAGNPYSYGTTKEDTMKRAIRSALEKGITFFDTADYYGLGRSEYLLGEELRNVRDKVVIGTKVGSVPDGKYGCVYDASYNHILASCNRSLKRLKTDYIDLYLLHFIPPDEDRYEAINALKKLKDLGKIKEYGISIAQNYEDLPQLVKDFRVIEGYYNMLFRKFEDYETLIKEYEIGFIAASPLSRGLLSGKDYDNVNFDESDIRRAWTRYGKQYKWYKQQKKNMEKLTKYSRENNIPLKNLALLYILSSNISTAIPGVRSQQQIIQLTNTLKYFSVDNELINRIREDKL